MSEDDHLYYRLSLAHGVLQVRLPRTLGEGEVEDVERLLHMVLAQAARRTALAAATAPTLDQPAACG